MRHKMPTGELAVIIETTPLCQYVVTSSSRFVWIEKRYSVFDAEVGDTICLVMKMFGWQRRWYGEDLPKGKDL